MIGRRGPVVGAVLGRRHLQSGQPIACWRVGRHTGETVQVLATVIPGPVGWLVVAEHTGGDRWRTTHVLSAADDRALRMLRRQGAAS